MPAAHGIIHSAARGTQLEPSLPPGFSRRHARGGVCGGLLVDVEAEFFTHVLFPVFSSEPSSPKIHRSSSF